MERCEWNAVLQKPALDPPRDTDCPNAATLSVGKRKNWHVCDQCARAPYFKPLRRRVPIVRGTAE